MKAVILAYAAPGEFAKRTNKALYKAYSATVLSMNGDRRVVEDGPYSDSKEQLGGFFVIGSRRWKKLSTGRKNARLRFMSRLKSGQFGTLKDERRAGDHRRDRPRLLAPPDGDCSQVRARGA